jgi:hypothetical protein
VCVIKSPNWYNTILPQVNTQAQQVASTASPQADTIADELIAASTGKGIKPDDFLTAIKKIGSDLVLYSLVDNIFKTGNKYDNKSIGKEWTFSDGLLGIIREQFIDKVDQFSYNSTSVNGGVYSNVKTGPVNLRVGRELNSLDYLIQIRDTLNSLGYILDVDLTNKNTSVKPSKLSNLLLSVSPSPPSKYFVGAKFNNIDFTEYDSREGIIMKDYKLSAVTISSSSNTSTASTTSATTSLILSTADALATAQQLSTLPKTYFESDELGIIGNIFISLDFLYKQSLSLGLESSDSKEKNEINLYSYVKSIMNAVQQSLGNVNNFDIHVDPVDNVARIIDINYTGNDKKSSLFKLEVQNLNSIVRSYSLQSQIFPNQSSIIAIGSQAKGGQLGVHNNTMTNFNRSLTDRVFPAKEDYNNSIGQNSSSNPIMASSLAGIVQLFAALNTDGQSVELPRYISQAKNALRDLIVYFQSVYSSNGYGGNRGIIPTKFSFEMDGIGGLVIGSLFKLDDEVLPIGYRGGNGIGAELAQTITGISHTIGKDWTTKVDALNIILDRSSNTLNPADIQGIVKEAVNVIAQAGINSSSNDNPQNNSDGGGGNKPPGKPKSTGGNAGKKLKCSGKIKRQLSAAEIAKIGLSNTTPWSSIKTGIQNSSFNVRAIGNPKDEKTVGPFAYVMDINRQTLRKKPINYVVLHYTAGYGDNEALKEYTSTWGKNALKGASADFVISRTGAVAGFKNYKTYGSWHYNTPTWGNKYFSSHESIGIEIQGLGPAFWCESSGELLDYYNRTLKPEQVIVTFPYDGHNIWEAHSRGQIKALSQLITAIYNDGAIDDKTTFLANCKATGRLDILWPESQGKSKLKKQPSPGIITHAAGSIKGKIDTFPQDNLISMMDDLSSFIKANPKITFNWVK